MTEEKERSTTTYVKYGLPIITILIFFALLNINNANVRIVDLTVADILFAVFWIFIIDLSIVAIVIIIIIVIWIIAR